MNTVDFTVHAFDPRGLALYAKTRYNRLTKATPAQVFAAVPAAVAIIDGPMWGGGGVAKATYRDKRMGVDLHGILKPGQGCFLRVKSGVASLGPDMLDADVSVQLYPCLVWRGQNIHTRGIDEGDTWRVGAGVLGDGRVAFAIGRGGMTKFADDMIAAGFTDGGYTDGGHSSVLAKRDGTIVKHAGLLPVDSYLMDLGDKAPPVPARTGLIVAGVVAAVAGVALGFGAHHKWP